MIVANYLFEPHNLGGIKCFQSLFLFFLMINRVQKIPFAYHLATKKYVDVQEVSRGANCGCICPSCELPLIANQGAIKSWHFSHHTHDSEKEVLRDCKFSFYVSVRYMAKQIFTENDRLEIHLPSYLKKVDALASGAESISCEQITITEGRTICTDEIIVDSSIANKHVDIEMKFNKHSLCALLRHPEYQPQTPDIEYLPEGCGILEINLADTLKLLLDKESVQSFRELLKCFLLENLDCKKWIYHPRQKDLIEAKKRELTDSYWANINKKTKAKQTEWKSKRYEGNEHQAPIAKYGSGHGKRTKCLWCGHRFWGSFNGNYGCPECGKK